MDEAYHEKWASFEGDSYVIILTSIYNNLSKSRPRYQLTTCKCHIITEN